MERIEARVHGMVEAGVLEETRGLVARGLGGWLTASQAIATLQNVSAGRLCLGIGFGWNVDEMAHHGVEYRTRRARTREHVLAMQALWRDDEASFDGEFVSFSPSWSWPKPDVEVPVLLGGGAGPKLFAHIAEYGHGWIPVGGAGLTDALPRFREAVVEAGRDPDSMEVVPFGSIPDPAKLEHFERIGVTEVVMRVPSAGRDEVLPILARQAELVAAHRG